MRKWCLSDNKIVVFGTGLNAVKCIYHLERRKIKIAYCLNNNCCENELCGYPVFAPDNDKIINAFIVVAVSMGGYVEISKQLEKKGLVEFRNYIYFEWLFKKVALLHGNCHMEVIKDFLMSSEHFSNIYAVYPNPPICCNAKGRVEKEVLENCDLWIHQDIRTDNEYGYFLSDEYMRSNIKADTIEIVIPNLFGLGKFLFIQTDWNKRNRAIANGKDKNGMFPQADKVIDMCVENGMDKNQILDFCLNGECFDEGEIKENFKACMEKIRKREKSWDVKISDFINMNYRNKKLFYDIGHPTNEILEKICIDILERVGIYNEKIYCNWSLNNHEDPVYPDVKRILELKWDDDFIRESNFCKKASDKMDFKEYILEYLWWCYGM